MIDEANNYFKVQMVSQYCIEIQIPFFIIVKIDSSAFICILCGYAAVCKYNGSLSSPPLFLSLTDRDNTREHTYSRNERTAEEERE